MSGTPPNPEPPATNDNPPPVPPPKADPPGAPAENAATFTQEQVTAMLAADKEKHRAKAQADLLEQTGFGSVEEAAAAKAAAAEAEKANMSATEIARAEAEADRAAAATALATAKKQLSDTQTTSTLVAAGMSQKLAATMCSTVGVGPEATAEETATIVEAFKVEHPELFAAAAPGAGGVVSTTPKPGTGGTGKVTEASNSLAAGAELAASMGFASKPSN